MWRSELLNLPGGCTVRFGEAFASFVRVPLSGSLPHNLVVESEEDGEKQKQTQSCNCSGLRASNLLITTSETSALHLPLFDELARSTSDIKRFLIALLYDEASKTITHVRTKAPTRLYAAHWPYMVALQDFNASTGPTPDLRSSSQLATDASEDCTHARHMELQPELLEVILFEGKSESCRFMLPLNFKRGTTRYLIMTDAGVFLITRRKIYFVSYSAIMSSMSLTRATTLVWSETDSLLSNGLQPLYDAKYCKCSGSTLVIANPYHIRIFTWDSVPVLCASGRTKVLEPSFSISTSESACLRLHADFDQNNLISDIRISPNGSLVLVQTQTSIFYWHLQPLPTCESNQKPLSSTSDAKMINLFEGDDALVGDLAFQQSHWQLSLILHVDDHSAVVGSVRCLINFHLDVASGKLQRDPKSEPLNLASNLAFLAPNSEFISMLGIQSVIPMHVTVNDKGGMALWDLSLSEPEALLAHAQLPLGPILDAYWLEQPGEIHFVVLHKERVLHKWIAIRHLISKSNSRALLPSRTEWSDALASPILYEGALKVKEDSGSFVERWVRLRPFVLFVYGSRYSTSNIGVYLLDPQIRLYRDGSSTRFTLANGRTKHDFVSPNSVEADRVVHALLYQLSSTHSLASIWTIPYTNAVTLNNSPTLGTSSSKLLNTGMLLSMQPVVLKDQPSTYPSTEFLMLTILEHPSIIPLIGLIPHSKRGERSVDPFLMQSHPALLDGGLSNAGLENWNAVRLVMPQQLLDLSHLIELLSDPFPATDDTSSEFSTDDANSTEDSISFNTTSILASADLEELRKMASTLGGVPSATASAGGPPLAPSQPATSIQTSTNAPNRGPIPLAASPSISSIANTGVGSEASHISNHAVIAGGSPTISRRHITEPRFQNLHHSHSSSSSGSRPYLSGNFTSASPKPSLRRPKTVPTGYIPWKTVLRILISLASGISTLHHFEFNGHVVPIAHRDIKCENVLIQASSIEDCVVHSRCKSLLADFEHAVFTRPFVIPGTKLAHFTDNPYMAKASGMPFSSIPKQPISGAPREETVGDERYRDPDESATQLAHDIYCFGLVAWQLMTLHPLGFGGNAVAQMTSVGGLNEETVAMLQRWCSAKSYDRPSIDGVMADLTDLALNVVLFGRQTTPALDPRLGFVVRKMYAHERLHASLVNAFVRDFPGGTKLKMFHGAPNTGKSLLLETAKELAEFCNFLPVFARAPSGRFSAHGVLLDLAADLYSEKYAAMPHRHMPLETEETRLIHFLSTRRDHYHAPSPLSWAALRSLFTRVSNSGVSLLLMIDDIHNLDDFSLHGLTDLLQEPFIFALASALPNSPITSFAPFMTAQTSMWDAMAGTDSIFQSPDSPTSPNSGSPSHSSSSLFKKQSSTAATDGRKATMATVNQILKGHFHLYFADDDSIGKVAGVPILKSLESKPIAAARPRRISIGSDSSLSSTTSSVVWARSSAKEKGKQYEMSELSLFGVDVVFRILTDRVIQEGGSSSLNTQKWRSAAERIIRFTLGVPAFVKRYLASVEDVKSFPEDVLNRRDSLMPQLKLKYSITYDPKFLWGSLSTNFRHKLIVASYLDFEFNLEDVPPLTKRLAAHLPTMSTDNMYPGDWDENPNLVYVFVKKEANGKYRFTSEPTRNFVRSAIGSPALAVELLTAAIEVLKQTPNNETYHYQQMMWELSIGMRIPKGDNSDLRYIQAMISAAAICTGTDIQRRLLSHLSAFLLSPAPLKIIMEHNPDLLITLCLELERCSLIAYALPLLEIPVTDMELPSDVQEELVHLRARLLMRSDQPSRYLSSVQCVMNFAKAHLPLPSHNQLKHSAILENIISALTNPALSQAPISASNGHSNVPSPSTSPRTVQVSLKSLPSNKEAQMNRNGSHSPPPSPNAASLVSTGFSTSSTSISSTHSSAAPVVEKSKLEILIQDELPMIVDHLALWLYPAAASASTFMDQQRSAVRSSSGRRNNYSSQRSTFVSAMPPPSGPLKWSFGPISSDSKPPADEVICKAFGMIESVLYLSNPTAVDFDGTKLEPLVVLYLYITYAFRKTICPYIVINCAAAMARYPGVSLQLFQLAWSLLNDWPTGFVRPNICLPFSDKYARDNEVDAGEIRARAYITLSTDFLYRLETHSSLRQYLEEARKIASMHHSQDLLAEVQLANCQFSLFLGGTADECTREVPHKPHYDSIRKYNSVLHTFHLCSQALLEPERAENLASVLSSRHRKHFLPEQDLPKIEHPILFVRSDIMHEDVLDYLVHAHTSLLLGDPVRAGKNIRRAFKYALLRRRTIAPRTQVPSFTAIYVSAMVAYVTILEVLRSTSKSKRDRLRKTIEANSNFLSTCAPMTSSPNTASARVFGTFAFHACGLVPTTLRLIETIKLVVKVLISHSKLNQESPLISPTQLPTFLHHYNTSVSSILPHCIEGMSRSTIKTLATFFGELGMKLGFISSTHHVSQFVLLASETYNCYADLKCYTRLRLLESSPSFVPYLVVGRSSRLRRELTPADYVRLFVDLVAKNPERSTACSKLLRDALDIAEMKPLLSLPKVLGGGSPAHVVYGLAGIQEVLQLFHDRVDYEVVIRPEQAVRSAVSRVVFVQFLLWCIMAFDHANRAVDDFFSPLEMKLMIGFLDNKKEDPTSSAEDSGLNTSAADETLSWTSPLPSVQETLDLRWEPPIQRHEERLPDTMDMVLMSSNRFRPLDDGALWHPLPYNLAQFLSPLMPHISTMQPTFKYHESRDALTMETHRAFKVSWSVLRPLKFSEAKSFIIVYDHEKKGLLSQSLTQKYGTEILIYMFRSVEFLWATPREASHILIHDSCWNDSYTPLLEVHQSRHPRTTYVFVSEKASTSSKPMFHITSFRQNVTIDIDAFHAQPTAPLLLPTE